MVDALRVPSVSQRPGSSLSSRSISRASQRPTSRLSQRTIIKQPRLAALLRTLVKQVTGFDDENDLEHVQDALDISTKRIEQLKQASVPDMKEIDAQFRGFVTKARINVQETLACALQAKFAELKADVGGRKDFDKEVRPSTLPNHLQFLLLLSSAPTLSTLSQAEHILTGKPAVISESQTVTWETILKEEPFSGQHWQGAYGLPEGSTLERWKDESSGSELSFLADAIYEDISSSESGRSPVQETRTPKNRSGPDSIPQTNKNISGRAIAESLHDRQYWQTGWQTDAPYGQEFDISEPSDLRLTFDAIVAGGPSYLSQPNDFINEIDAVREVLLMLQGRQSCLFESAADQGPLSVKVLREKRLLHLTAVSQASMLSSFVIIASTLHPLREFEKKTVFRCPPGTIPRCRTLEAFAAAVGHQLHIFDVWCVTKEEHIARAQLGESCSMHVVSLLNLKQEMLTVLAGKFTDLLNILHTIESKQDQYNPSMMSSLILNHLLEAIRRRMIIHDTDTAEALLDVWREAAEPLWSNLRQWLQNGIPVSLGLEDRHRSIKPTWDEKEFFIRINPLIDITSSEFWDGCYKLPTRHTHLKSNLKEEENQESAFPGFLMHLAEEVLAAGKAVGLLRAIDMMHFIGEDWLQGWVDFKTLTNSLPLRTLDTSLENLLIDTLLPSCRQAQSWLHRVLVEECDLWKHIQGLENVYLMTRGDAMSRFGEILFARMDSRQPWNDFHFLNTAFRKVTKLSSHTWINSSLVRFSYRGNKDRSINRTVRAIDGLAIEYAVPFPLTYLLGPDSSASYSSLFCFLLQIRRSKSVLDGILIRGLNNGVLDSGIPDLKIFYVLRGKLSWFVNTLMTFIMTNVIHANLLEFHAVLCKADSLDEMISSHRTHLDRLLGRCLLQPNTSALHRAILSILDLSLHFSDCLSAFAGDLSLDVSRHSSLIMRHKHPRRGRSGRARKPDVIGFAGELPSSDDDSNTSEFSSDENAEVESSVISLEGGSISFAEESFVARLDRMAQELDGLVRFIRRGIESLAAGTGEAASTFGVLAFCLEDWEL